MSGRSADDGERERRAPTPPMSQLRAPTARRPRRSSRSIASSARDRARPPRRTTTPSRPGRPEGQDELRDDRRAGLRARVHRFARRRTQHSGREKQPHRGRRRRWPRPPASRDPQPGPARRPVPQLGDEVGEGQDHERQGRVVVVLERGPVDARPRHPLGREADGDERQREATAAERHDRREHERRRRRATR